MITVDETIDENDLFEATVITMENGDYMNIASPVVGSKWRAVTVVTQGTARASKPGESDQIFNAAPNRITSATMTEGDYNVEALTDLVFTCLRLRHPVDAPDYDLEQIAFGGALSVVLDSSIVSAALLFGNVATSDGQVLNEGDFIDLDNAPVTITPTGQATIAVGVLTGTTIPVPT